MILKGLSAAPRFLAIVLIIDSSLGLRSSSAMVRLFEVRPFFKRAKTVLKRSDTGSLTKTAFFSSFIFTAPSLERFPKAEPTSLFSRPRAAAISGSFKPFFSFKRFKILSSGVPRSAKSAPIGVSSKKRRVFLPVSFIRFFILSHEKT